MLTKLRQQSFFTLIFSPSNLKISRLITCIWTVFCISSGQVIATDDSSDGLCLPESSSQPIPLIPMTTAEFPDWAEAQTLLTQSRLKDANFTATDTSFFPVYSPEGKLESVIFGFNNKDDF